MKKVAIGVLSLALLIPTPAHGATVKYKNQKAGQSCKAKYMNKTVTLPNSMILVCKMDGDKHKWKPKGQM
jgi:hypothetical protein